MAKSNRLSKEEIKEDKFVDFVLQTYEFIKDNLRIILIVCGIVVVAVASYAAYHQNRENRRAEAAFALNKANEAYQTAEATLFDTAKLPESEEAIKTAQTQLQAIFQQNPNTTFADNARYQHAKTLYYQGNYVEARAQFEQIINTHQPQNQIYSLYAQKAIGNCYEQEGDYEKAITAYQAARFSPTPNLPPEIRQFVLANATFHQALCYEKLGNTEMAQASYKEILEQFRTTLAGGLEQKSAEMLQDAKRVVDAINEPLELGTAEQFESEGRYYDAFVAYTDEIRTYKVKQDVQGGLASDLRKQIRDFEKHATTIIKNVEAARRADAAGRTSTALNNYNAVVEFAHLGLSRHLYENSLLNHNRLTTATTGKSE